MKKRKPDFYSVNDLNAFFRQQMKPAYKNAFLGLLYTGMRFGELANITWDDVDFITKHVIVKSDDHHLTKKPESERRIPINKNLYDLLKQISNNKLSNIYTFCNPNGNKISERTLIEVCKRTTEKAGIPGRSFLHRINTSAIRSQFKIKQ